MTPEVQSLFDIIQQLGFAALFAWLYISEKRDHNATRREKDTELEKSRSAHLADIREFARIAQSLYTVSQPAVPRDRNDANHVTAPAVS